MERLKGLIARKRTGRSQGSSTSSQPTTSKAVAGIQGARNVQVTNANINVVGGDSHTHVHNHAPLTDDLKAILDAIANMRKIQQDTLAKATPGTLEWLFKSQFFGSWWDMNSDLMMVWGSGIPGAGKTILSSILINDIECRAAEAPDQICVAYFYMRYSEHGEVTVRSVLEVLVKQSVERHERFLPLVAQTYERHIRERTKPTEEQLLGLLREFTARTLITVYALDALDEAPVNIQLDLVKKLASLNARIFITSRPMQDLQAYFPKACCFDIAARAEDLDLHIAQKLENSPRLQSLLTQGDAAQKELLISTVKSKCGGMFLHASLQMDALQNCLSLHSTKRILDSFPAKIEDVYQQTLERISNQDPEHIAIVKTALLWVVHAKSSMTVNELRHAVATCPEISRFEEDRLVPASTIIGLCHGLLVVDEESNLVRLVHYTAKRPLDEFLNSTFAHPQAVLAAVCMTHLTENGLQHASPSPDSGELLWQALEADPLLAYAHEAWAFHALEALDLEGIANQLRVFVLGCRSFPVIFGHGAFRRAEHLRPVHMLVFYDLPTECLLPCIIVDEHTCIERLTALGFASTLGRRDAIITLLFISLRDILANIRNMGRNTTLHITWDTGQGNSYEVLLSTLNFEDNLANCHGFTPLILISKGQGMWNTQSRVFNIFHWLDADLAIPSGSTTLITASKFASDDMVKRLLDEPRIQVNLTDDRGGTALMFACGSDRRTVVQLLLAHPDIDINLADKEGDTPLILSVRKHHRDVVELLLSHPDIDVNVENKHRSSAFTEASSAGYQDIIDLLLAHPK